VGLDFLIGVILLGIAAVLIFFGLSDKEGVNRRFLRFGAAVILYPPVIMIFLVGGGVEILKALWSGSH
jgi:hypothetical protein